MLPRSPCEGADLRYLAFQTILRNRTLHGGILAPGSGLLKHGENGKGIRSRWYPETLRKRIQNIKFVREKITFIQDDGIETIKKYASRSTSTFFIDPPYTAAGKRAGSRLYTHSELDHDKLFKECRKIQGDFLMTYDNVDEVVAMAKKQDFEVDLVSMTGAPDVRRPSGCRGPFPLPRTALPSCVSASPSASLTGRNACSSARPTVSAAMRLRLATQTAKTAAATTTR